MLRFSESKALELCPVAKSGRTIRNYTKPQLLHHFTRGRPVRCGDETTDIFHIPEGAKVALRQGRSRVIVKVQ